MRRYRALAAGGVLLAALIAAAEPAAAQSLLQRLFGYGGSRTPEYRDGRVDAFGYSSRFDDGYGWEEDHRSYRTLCVRLCDGYYFPIGDSVRRERLYQDNRTCSQRCEGEARLFYYPTQGGSVETMVDMAGHPYASLPNAFRYRKSLVAGCSCKAPPWSAQEAARHQSYAVAEARKAAGLDSEPPEEDRHAAASAPGEGPYYERQPEPPPRSARRPGFFSRWFGWR